MATEPLPVQPVNDKQETVRCRLKSGSRVSRSDGSNGVHGSSFAEGSRSLYFAPTGGEGGAGSGRAARQLLLLGQ